MPNNALQVGDRVRVTDDLSDDEADQSFAGCEGRIDSIESCGQTRLEVLYDVMRDVDGKIDSFYAAELILIR